jgi:hypothetical protein
MATVMTAQRELHGYISEVSDWSLSFTNSLALTFGCQVGVVRDLPSTAVVQHAPAKCGAASNDLTDFSCHRDTSAESRHTSGTRRDGSRLICWGLES